MKTQKPHKKVNSLEYLRGDKKLTKEEVFIKEEEEQHDKIKTKL